VHMVRRALVLGLIPLAALASTVSAQVGSATRVRTITGQGYFGASLATLGDLNGDGVGDLAVGAPTTGGSGGIWLNFLAPDGSLQNQKVISQTQGGFTGTLQPGSLFGGRITNVGDLDGDGVPELAAFSGLPNRLWILFLKRDGTLKGQREIQFTDPAFVPATSPTFFDGEQLFPGLEALGDLDGDGHGDLAVGSPFDPDGGGFGTGAIWILYLNANGSLKSTRKISQIHGGFVGDITLAQFGTTVTQLGDLDGDGNRELAVQTFNGYATWILYLDANETVTNQHVYLPSDWAIGLGHPRFVAWLGDLDGDGSGEVALGFGQYANAAIGFLRSDGSIRKRLRGLPFDAYRWGSLGDINGDGAPEIAVGDPHGEKVLVVTLDTSASRNGSGVNPTILTQTKEPVFGTSWTATLDCSGHAPGFAAIYGFSAAASPVLRSPFGEVLVTGLPYFHVLTTHASGPTTLQVNMPPLSLALIDLQIHVQGVCTGAPGARLSNALDVVLGQ